MALECSVIVPVKDGAASIPELLDSLAVQTLASERYEVVVVDNGSRDGSGELAASRGARVVREPRPNRARARNAGVAAARSGVLAFTDADCIVAPEWLSALLSCRADAPLIAGPVEMVTESPSNAIERFESAWRFDQASAVTQGWAATANLMVERRVVDAVGGFDVAYGYGEDVDLCQRAREAGYALTFCPAALVRHRAERTLAPVIRRAFRHGYGAAQLTRRSGRGYVAWRHPQPLLSPRMALAFHGVHAAQPSEAERVKQTALAMTAYASRMAGSVWAEMRRAR